MSMQVSRQPIDSDTVKSAQLVSTRTTARPRRWFSVVFGAAALTLTAARPANAQQGPEPAPPEPAPPAEASPPPVAAPDSAPPPAATADTPEAAPPPPEPAAPPSAAAAAEDASVPLEALHDTSQ